MYLKNCHDLLSHTSPQSFITFQMTKKFPDLGLSFFLTNVIEKVFSCLKVIQFFHRKSVAIL